jgi:ribose 5-phosphate isomerase B
LKIGIAADHAGQRLKSVLAEHLTAAGHSVVVVGPRPETGDDYPGIVVQLATAITSGIVERGIFCCGSGIGPAVAANKRWGIRAAVVENEWSARDAVEHVDVNLLTLGERVIGEELAKSIVDAYLSAKVQAGRHERRRDQIKELETDRPSLRHDVVAMSPYERKQWVARWFWRTLRRKA